MLIFSAFKTLTNQTVTVELKNDVSVTGTLKSVDQYLNFRIDDLKVIEGDQDRWPHLAAVKSAFIRGSVIRYVHIPASAVDTTLLEDATRREAAAGRR
ncbi:U6 snRNA-associated Sm-like protein LSm2 [Meira miltonrushii]|uniref:U6 snRNA-associated Sm-like protein LSm2 n=1 Tax=Meira miltonrushii TaxID=1280837 RepID=A0A316VP48_9BASI|nr:U6 snRNA-associated Sm-like protein LSm2 [Meira miltonrushii]PWN37901.1 U6 snRNA-associated Sm-like protein LSm2 [Meira miltonrushii]